jgi:hypothetical protein
MKLRKFSRNFKISLTIKEAVLNPKSRVKIIKRVYHTLVIEYTPYRIIFYLL